MKTRLALFLLFVLSVSAEASQRMEDPIKWKFDSKTGAWTSSETGITLRKSMAGFKQSSAAPYDKDGSAFGYMSQYGAITVIVERRGVGGYPGTGDCTPQVRANYLQVMHKSYGKADSERSLALGYSSGGKRGRGVGTVCHFVSFPTFGNMPAYSEIGVVLIGDVLLEYRCSFINETGMRGLNAFLRALGIRKA